MDGLTLSDHLPQSRDTALSLAELSLYTGLTRSQITQQIDAEREAGAQIIVDSGKVWIREGF